MILLLLIAVLALVALAVLLALALCRAAGLASRGEEAGADDWMDIADVVSAEHAAALAAVDDHFAEDYVDDAVCLEGFTPQQTAVLRANYLPMTDDERFRLDMAWRSIVEGADR